MLTGKETALIISLYFGALLIISYLTSKKSDFSSFFTGNKKSPWFIVSYGMIGAALSAVTFVSIPGNVLNKGFYSAQFFVGNMIGYTFITFILIPLYYKMNLVSIYSYLEKRFGFYSYKTGSFFFLLSQSFGAGLRMLLAIKILQVIFGLENSAVWWLSSLFLILIFIYTFKAGIKTIVWTDLLQTTFLLAAAISIVIVIFQKMGISTGEIISIGKENGYWKWIDTDINSGSFWGKQILSGALISMAMMGLDQNMMQKSLTCKNVKEAQMNTFVFSFTVAIAQILFLFLGMMLYIYADTHDIELPTKIVNQEIQIATDKVLPFLTMNHFGIFSAIMFVLGTAAAAFSSVDSAITALTTSFSYDFLKIDKRSNSEKIKTFTHIGFSVILLILILIFNESKDNVFNLIFSLAGYTYSPLLGLFLIGIFTNVKLNDKTIPFACLLTPIISFLINQYLSTTFKFDIGFLTILTGAIVVVILSIILSKIFKNENNLSHSKS